MILRKTIFLLMFLVICFSVYCEDNEDETNEIISEEVITDDILQNEKYNEETIFIINSFNYNIIGRTLPFVLNNKTELKKGEEITGKTNFIKFIKDKRQLLVNERVLKDDVKIEYVIGEMTEDGKYPVDLQIYVEDTWNIIALPYPKYSSNYGFELTIKARDYNFFGSMQAFRVDLGYKYDQNGRSYFSLMLDSGMPFQLFELNWFFDFDNYFGYRPELSEPFYYKNRTGISVDIPIKHTTLTIWFAESFLWNEENSDSDKSVLGDVQKGLYMSSYPSISWKIPTGLEIGEYGELTYNPKLYAVINHEISPWPLSYTRIGPNLYFSHSLYFERVNWIGNFRQGLSIDIGNSYGYDFYYMKKNWDPWNYSYRVTAKGYFIFINDRLGLSNRLSFRHWIDSHYEYSGDVLRGVYDRDVDAEYILALNLDLELRALRIKPSEWFPNIKFMRVFEFDMHVNPVLDCAFYKDYKDPLKSEKFCLGAGFEIIIYPHRFRSMFFRISTCWDFSDISKKTPIELFLGMEHYY